MCLSAYFLQGVPNNLMSGFVKMMPKLSQDTEEHGAYPEEIFRKCLLLAWMRGLLYYRKKSYKGAFGQPYCACVITLRALDTRHGDTGLTAFSNGIRLCFL